MDGVRVVDGVQVETAFEQVYRTHWATVHRYAARRVGPDAAADVAAATFATAWRRVKAGGEVPTVPWLIATARNHVLNMVRGNRRRRALAERAAILRRMAEIDAFRYRGEVVDRAGRPSFAFSARTDVHGGLDEVVILLDAGTGAMNGREDLQLTSVGDIEVGDEPVLRWSQTILAVAHVDAVGERP